jgi:hypothetical protein
MPVEMGDAAGCGLRSNESLTKEIVVCCYTCDLEMPRKITKVKVIVLLQTFHFFGHNYYFPFLCFILWYYRYYRYNRYLVLFSCEFWEN